ncbi:efflux RND transporter permease subunit [Caballeronia mineralivorans]|jgi:multidrug efflux pump subunit AcrB|uniref:efflux RND transporter permease subunit n=3 Tax=Caballeronia mineralivorans TaxID=2010198 RepID=UPI0023F4CF47|nr:efflux RND transporter permease subunit [Caballeronia mineralivorans]MDB5781176.1 czcA [Caballeronia mineralivorans]
MNFATWSIHHRIPVVVLFIFLSFAGFWGFHQLPVANMPDLDLPTINVTLSLPGAAPAQLEADVARKAEDALATLQGIKHQSTQIVDGQVHIQVKLFIGRNISDALNEAKDAIDQIRSQLPADLDPPIITAVRSDSNPIMTFAVASTRLSEVQLSWFIDDTVSKAVLAVPGVAQFERVGGVTREVRIDVDPVKLASTGMTAVDLSRALRSMQVDASGGRGRWGSGEQSMRVLGTVAQAADLDRFPLTLADGRSISLDQVARVSDTVAEQTQSTRLGEHRVVGFRIYRAKGADETQIATRVEEALQTLRAADPALSLRQVSSTVDYTREQYKGSMDMLYEGAVLAVLVVWWFLRNSRATLAAAAALPLSILPTFAAMQWLGYSLNTLTLLALAVVIGVLVDDAIVEIENIERHAQMGKPILQAATDAVIEIALPVTATTLSLVAIFLPTAQMSGVPGLFFKQFGWTAVVAVLMSLLVARLLTPMMAVALLSHSPPHDPKPSRLMQRYRTLVYWCLAHKKTTLVLTAALLAGSIALIPLIPTGFVPTSDRGFIEINVELSPGSALDTTRAVEQDARRALAGLPGIEQIFSVAGGNATTSFDSVQTAGTRFGTMTLMLLPRGQRPSQASIEQSVRARLATVAGARFSVGGGDLGQKFEMILTSDNTTALTESANLVAREMRSVPGLFNVASSASIEQPEIEVRPNMTLAAERGISTATIGEAVRITTSGDFDPQLPRLNLDDRQIFVRVRLGEKALEHVSSVFDLRLKGRDGLVPLGSIADIAMGSGPAEIARYDRKRYVSLTADLSGAALGAAVDAVKALPSVRALPSNVQLLDSGDADTMAELSSGFALAMFTGILCVYLLLVVLFRDFFQPITILSALPLCLGGSFVMLLVTGSELDVPSMVGLVMLMGIVTKNSILLVDYAIRNLEQGQMTIVDALVDACMKRARAIVMTTVAMTAGMLPIALGLGADASFRQPMAFAVIGGLLTSTALSLLVVPVVFTYVDAFRRRAAALTLWIALRKSPQ